MEGMGNVQDLIDCRVSVEMRKVEYSILAMTTTQGSSKARATRVYQEYVNSQ